MPTGPPDDEGCAQPNLAVFNLEQLVEVFYTQHFDYIEPDNRLAIGLEPNKKKSCGRILIRARVVADAGVEFVEYNGKEWPVIGVIEAVTSKDPSLEKETLIQLRVGQVRPVSPGQGPGVLILKTRKYGELSIWAESWLPTKGVV